MVGMPVGRQRHATDGAAAICGLIEGVTEGAITEEAWSHQADFPCPVNEKRRSFAASAPCAPLRAVGWGVG